MTGSPVRDEDGISWRDERRIPGVNFRESLNELAALADRQREVLSARDAEIIRQAEQGVPAREISRAAGLSQTAVRHIIARG